MAITWVAVFGFFGIVVFLFAAFSNKDVRRSRTGSSSVSDGSSGFFGSFWAGDGDGGGGGWGGGDGGGSCGGGGGDGGGG